ncbi:uncharacterized protein [Henckelia pumila]|uniref:uncharacterized protein n=1 Tax=Henckelia pumila TaxID=405737 RepID=UPI003C6DD357
MRMFGLIADCTVAKDAWEALQEHCEETDSVRRTRLRFLNTKFENLRMDENETIADYDKRIRKITTEAFALREPITSENMVNKVLRSLPKRFNGKIWALEEVKDNSNMKMTELISILQVFEMNFTAQEKDKGKSIALQESKPSYEEYVQFHQEVLQSNLEDDLISLITKKFNDYLKKMKETKKSDQKLKATMFPNKPLRITGPKQSPRKPTDTPKPRLMLEGKKKKGMNTSLSDEESDEDEELEDEEDHTALSALLEIKKKFQVKEDLGKVKATLAEFNSSTTKLDSLLAMGRDDKAGLGFENSKFEEDYRQRSASKVLPKVLPTPSRSWYFDSGSSRHMTGSNKFLIDYVDQKSGRVNLWRRFKGKHCWKRNAECSWYKVI